MRIEVRNLEDLPRAAAAFLEATCEARIFAFDAPMGAGKTTFIAEICRQKGISDTANSPSFSIINEYRPEEGGEPLYHFDFYRLQSALEAVEIGAQEYFYSGNICLIEWPERVEEILPPETVRVRIEVRDDGTRVIEF